MHRSHARLLCPENMMQLAYLVSKQWSGQFCQGESHNIKVKSEMGQVKTIVHRFHVRLMCLEKYLSIHMYRFWVEQWTRQDFQGEGHNIKVKGQTQQCTGPISSCPEIMKQLTHILYSFWAMAQLRSVSRFWRSKGQNNLTVNRFHIRLISPEKIKQFPLHKVTKQWPWQCFHSEGYNNKVAGQKVKMTPYSEIPC